MPLGNLTSQFLANVYLNELDQFVKHKLKAKYYLRYVDDFIILHHSRRILEQYKEKINKFLNKDLNLELHPDKSRILKLLNGVSFLGFRVFFHHKLIRKKNQRKFEKKFGRLKTLYKEGILPREKAIECFEGWLAYLSHANTYKYRNHLTRLFNHSFPLKPATKTNNPKKHKNFIKKTNVANLPFSSQKTRQLFKRGLTPKQIAEKRNLKESTVWHHFVQLIEYNQLLIWKLLPKKKISQILPKIKNQQINLKDIKERINDSSITFNEIHCVLAYTKSKNQKLKSKNNSCL